MRNPVILNVSTYSPSELGSLIVQAASGYGCTVTVYTQQVPGDEHDEMCLYCKIEGEHAAQFADC